MKIKNVFAALLFFATAFHTLGQTPPLVTVTMPTNGATYFAPANIYLTAEASDSNGIAAVNLYVGTNWMGGTKSNSFVTVWTNAPVGTYSIVGNTMNNLNVWGTSAPVVISVISNPLPIVSITATDSHATEGGDDLGQFKISRTGDLTNDLTVSYSITGTASNGVDIVTLPTSVTIPTGSSNATLTVQPIDDTIIEITESVTLTLKTNSTYRLGSPTAAIVYVYDNEVNHPPTVQLTNPHDGDNFADPVTISLTADASDIDGPLSSVSFFRNGVLIAYGSKNPTNNTFNTTWTNVPAGNFAITALARDGINTSLVVTSAPVNITVTRTNPGPYVVVTAPTDGKAYTNSNTAESITLSAYASTGDATHHVTKVEFFVDSTLFRTFTNNTSPTFSTQWTNPPAGTHVFSARATDDGGNSTDSSPVMFSIVLNQVLVVYATDATASEPGTDTGTFTITRRGNVTNPLVVNYRLTGSASNGVDYSFLPGSVSFSAGVSNALVIVQPIDDTLFEGTETVTLTLLASNFPPGAALGSADITATVSIYDNDTNPAPTVSILTPTNNSTFTLPTNILLQAEAHDDGTVTGVAFYRGTDRIGTTYASSNTASPIFSFLWTNPPTGDFSITARAYDNLQAAATSAPVHVVISAPISNATPNVSIYYPTNGSKFTMPTNVELTAIASESNGVIATVQFFANGSSVGIATNNPASAQPGNVFHVTWANPSPGSYALTAKATDTNGVSNTSTAVNVTVVIPNIPPTVSIDSPTNNSVFYGPTNITFTAQASDTDGQIARVYFYSGTRIIGSATNAPYSVIWSNLTTGSYSVIAKAIDNQEGAGYSAPITIVVRSWSEVSFVSRSLPIWYVPGVKLTVKLQASPKTNTTSYVVQDTPPAGWTINSVGENGSIDTGGLGVTFGPFNDKLARTFTYTVTPPGSDSSEKHFVGTGTANGLTSPILGVSAITAAQPHPADLNPTNYFISTNELDAYTLAWKQCAKWPVSPSPVPVNYLTRAGYIVRGGGGYAVSTNYPTPQAPLIWVRDSATPDNTTNTLVGSVPWTTNNYGSAVATMPTNYFSNVTFTVSISIAPATPCSAYAVEDRPPVGWIVSNVSDGGFYCPILKKVKWGLFLDNQARTLTYQITPATNLPTAVGFSGVASFDGIDVPITGRRYAYFTGGTVPPAKLQSIITSPSGDRIITFLGQPGIVYRLDGSDNLTDWTRIDQLLNADGVLYYTDPSTNAPTHFYRAVPTDGN